MEDYTTTTDYYDTTDYDRTLPHYFDSECIRPKMPCAYRG